MKITHFLMGTIVTIEVSGEGLEPAADSALKEMGRIERLMSRFLPTSDIANLNASYCHPVKVSPETFWVIEKALLFSRLSQGAFDITVNSQNKASYKDVILDKGTYQVCLRKPGMSLDLGGIAKGYAVDKGIEVLQRMGVQNALVSAGGDLRVLGSHTSENGWIIGVQHPGAHNGLLCRLSLTNKAVATSGDYYRHNHILDPHQRKPARGCLSATIIANQTLVADALATATFVLGPHKGMKLLGSLPGVEGLLVGDDGSILSSSGLPADWNENSVLTIKDNPRKERRNFQVATLLGGMALIAALTLGCQSEANVQQPSLSPESPQTTTESRVLLDGAYQGKSISGILVEVEVTVTSGRIADIQILEYKELSSIHAGKPTDEEKESWETSKKAALETIPQRIIEKQSTKVDIVTGATMSSKTIMAAVEDALVKAEVQPGTEG